MAERRQLTMMYCDLVDSTGLSERHDPEDVREMLDVYQQLCIEEIVRWGGQVSHYAGDGLMAQFGYPVAIERGPQAAVRAALAIILRMRAASQELDQRFAEPLHVRIGLQTGVVVVGDMGPEDHRQVGALVGEAANVAARLQAIAQPDTVVVGGTTQALLEGRFDVRPLGPQTLKGLSREVLAYEVLGERDDADHIAGRSSEFVGRTAELETLTAAWEATRANRGSAIQIVGDAGIGKSRLVRELRESLGARAACVEISGSVHHRNAALHPFIEFLRRDPERLASLDGDAQARGLLKELVDPAALRAGVQKPAPVTPETRRMLHDLLVAAILREANTRALLVVVEDAHWLDPTSLEVVERILAAAAGKPAMIVITSRETMPLGARLSVPPQTLRLGRLDPRSCRRIVECIAGDEVSDNIVHMIADRCDGTPLFAEELTLAFVATGGVRGSGSASLAGDSQVPAALHDSLMARLDRLGGAKTVAQQAAVLGRRFRHDLLVAVHGSGEGLEPALQQLVAAGVILPDESGADVYEFKHALLRDAAYQSLLKVQRRALHLQVGEAIETHYPELKELEPDLVAQHWAQAGEHGRAARQWLHAARLSAMRSSNVEALAQTTAAVDQVKQLPAGPQRDGLELAASVAMMGPLISTKGYGAPEVETLTARALELARCMGPPTPEGIATAFPILYCRWSHLQVTGRVREAHELARAIIAQSEAQPSIPPRIIGHRLLGTSQLLRGRPAEARAHLEQALALYDPSAHAGLAYVYGTDVGVMTRCHLAFAYWHVGDLAGSAREGAAALAAASAAEHANTTGYALTHLCLLRALERDIPGMAALAMSLVELSRVRELPFWGAVAMGFLGWHEACAGRSQEGLAKLLGGLQFMGKMNLVYWMPTYRTWVAEAQLASGDLDAAERSLADALDVVERGDERWFESECFRVRARLQIAQGHDRSVALATLAQAMKTASANESRSFELRTALDAYRLLEGDHAHAWGEPRRDMLQRYLAPFRDGPQMADQKEAAALLGKEAFA
ncbi:MAG: AAA family ATPase [Burkholderiales bacterium]